MNILLDQLAYVVEFDFAMADMSEFDSQSKLVRKHQDAIHRRANAKRLAQRVYAAGHQIIQEYLKHHQNPYR